ncbi:hypothetical protein SISNIDRAFT_475843 [Sistotremastrum niveocremeum HHB9708]|uniref:Uncharacterized protein n=1 Tax=Sistotremastrum niveocremeum HHB9708 TaxID=1314777 RepID=A0A164PU04_9AGAM|nr:hypothetical protein SISNIDRAFT_475843 [Sistotremastrum niveocremeum HHB9708]
MIFASALIALQIIGFALASPLQPRAVAKDEHEYRQKKAVAYYSPASGGGSMLDNAGDGFGEPLNVIISGLSDPTVLTDAGFLNFARAAGLSTECLGLHLGAPQSANLGDGHGPVNQTTELRQDFGDVLLGTCLESLVGGNHLRVFRQNGPTANSGALVSSEQDVEQSHNIIPNGYDIGRDNFVTSATAAGLSYNNVKYSVKSETVSGLLQPGSSGINHGISIDGNVILLTVHTA